VKGIDHELGGHRRAVGACLQVGDVALERFVFLLGGSDGEDLFGATVEE
jgi:hypothetical protein